MKCSLCKKEILSTYWIEVRHIKRCEDPLTGEDDENTIVYTDYCHTGCYNDYFNRQKLLKDAEE